MTIVWIVLAGGLGALVRFVVDGLIRTAFGRRFPWGTLFINVSGTFALGLITSLAIHHTAPDVKLILGTGFCGGFTTFSTASFETVRLLEERRHVAAGLQSLGSAALALAAALLGLSLLA